MNIYSKTHLPKDGWILGCFQCSRPTSKTIEYNYKSKTYNVYVCTKCHTDNKDDTRNNKLNFKLSHSIELYINDHTLEPYKQPRISLEPPKIRSHSRFPYVPAPVFPVNTPTPSINLQPKSPPLPPLPPHELDNIV